MACRVYIIDDEAAVLAATESLLASYGYAVRGFCSATHFLAEVGTLPPGCIVADLRMPGRSGIEMHAELLGRGFDWPVIFLSGDADVRSVVRAVKQGALEFIEKPYDAMVLLSAIRAASDLVGQRQREEVNRIRAALQRDGIFPHYQPAFDLSTGALTGLEALLRWSGEAPQVDRAKAIHDAFQDPRLGRAVSNRMLDAVLADLAAWRAEGLDVGRISFNASTCDLEDEGFAPHLIDRLDQFGLPASAIQVEVTELVTLDLQGRGAIGTLEALAAAGISIALDDFGTGFASLTHLQNLPVDVVKIDRSFVGALPGGASASIVRAIIGLAHGLGKTVVAEGVETCAQAEFLRRSGCEQAQGYLFGAPVPADAVPAIASVPPASGQGWSLGWSSRARLAG